MFQCLQRRHYSNEEKKEALRKQKLECYHNFKELYNLIRERGYFNFPT